MAVINREGITPTDLTAYKALTDQAFRDALGNDLNLEPETPQGQMSGTLALRDTQNDQLALYVAAGMNKDSAVGRQVDDFGTLFDLPRIQATRSEVTATLTGTAGTEIPAGSRARTTNGALFFLVDPLTIDADGSTDGLFRAVDRGPVAIGVGILTRIVDVISGWEGITNAAAGTVGRNDEEDVLYKRRYDDMVATHSVSANESIRGRVLQVTGVTGCIVRDNPTTAQVTVQGVMIPAGAMIVIVEGGTDADVAMAIAMTRPPATVLAGSTSVSTTVDGQTVAINFQRVTTIPIAIALTIRAETGLFPSNGFATIRSNILAWFAGTWRPASGIFDQSGVQIGQSLDLRRLQSPINAVPYHEITILTVTRVAGGAVLGTPDLDERYTLASENITIALAG